MVNQLKTYLIDLQVLRAHYGIDASPVQHITDGGYASIYRIDDIAVRISNDSRAIADLEDDIRRTAQQLGTISDAILTKDGKRHAVVADTIWRLTPFSEGKQLRNAEITDQHLQNAAIELAKFHAALAGLAQTASSPDYKRLPIVHTPAISVARERVFKLLEVIIAAQPSLVEEHRQFLANQKGFILSQFDRLQSALAKHVPTLPITVVHGDYMKNNILFNPDGSVTQILDFGMAGRAPRIDDIAGPLLENEHKQPDLKKIKVFLSAYQKAATPILSDLELDLLAEEFRRFSLQEIFYELSCWAQNGQYSISSIQRRIAGLQSLDQLSAQTKLAQAVASL